MKNINFKNLSVEDVKKIVKEEVEKKTYKQDRLINKIHRKMIDLERMI